MNGMSRQPAPPRARAFDTVVLGGLTAGVLDIIDAIVVTLIAGSAPTRMLQAIASRSAQRRATHPRIAE